MLTYSIFPTQLNVQTESHMSFHLILFERNFIGCSNISISNSTLCQMLHFVCNTYSNLLQWPTGEFYPPHTHWSPQQVHSSLPQDHGRVRIQSHCPYTPCLYLKVSSNISSRFISAIAMILNHWRLKLIDVIIKLCRSNLNQHVILHVVTSRTL